MTDEFELHKKNEELEAKLLKQDTQRKIAWTSVIAMLVVTAVLFLPTVDNARIETLAPLLDWFYIAQASIVGAFMGFTTWMSKK